MSSAPNSSPPPLPATSLEVVVCHKRIWECAGLDEPSETPRKRPRTLDILRSPHLGAISEPLVHDTQFYFPDGDLTLFAKNTVFKVHTVMLARDGSIFEYTLKRRHEDGGDRIPREFTLPEESPRHFRQLLWALYVRAPEVHAMGPQNIKVDKMLEISHASSKYGFVSYEKWALDVVHDFFKQLPEDGEQFLAQGHTRLDRVLKHATRSDHSALRKCLSERWASLVSTGQACPAQVIDIAEKWNLSSLRGYTYYNTLLKQRITWDADDSLSTQQRITLLSGFERLVVRWEELKATLLDLNSAPSECGQCSGNAQFPIWGTALRVDGIEKCQAADVLGKLRAVQKALVRVESEGAQRHCAECMKHALGVLDQYIIEFQSHLSDFFTDVL